MTWLTVQEAYAQWAATYDHDRNLTRDLDSQVTRAQLGAQRFRRVLELGCGTGKNTALFARIADEVHGLDFSSAMLDRARARGLGDHVRFTRTDLAQPWPVADGWADLVSANLVLEHLPELEFVFREAARVLARGGIFFVAELHPFKQYLGSKAVFEGVAGRVDFPAFTHHLSDFLAAARPAGLAFAGLDEHWHAEDDGKPPRLVSLKFQPAARS